MLSSYVLAVIFLSTSIAAQTPFIECGNGLPTPNNVDLTGCLVEPCIFVRGTNSFHRFDFTSVISTNTIRPSVRAIILGIGIEYPLPEHVLNGCLSLQGSSCPIDAGEDVTYILEVPVSPDYPEVSVDFEFSILGDNNVVLSCSRTRVSVVSP